MAKIKKLIMFMIFLSLFTLVGCTSNSYTNESLKIQIIDSKTIESTVLIVKEEILQQNDDTISTSYTYGFSGVIIKKEGFKYYVLTAHHPIEDATDENLYILLWDEPRYNDLSNDQKTAISLYYQSKPKGTIEYTDIKYDLAIISFETDRELMPLEISDVDPKYNDEVAVISNPRNKERNYLSFGKVTTKLPVPFGDDKDDQQYHVIEHTAYVSEGSSGSVLLNTELKIIGINLGGSTNAFGNFKKAKAMSSDRIQEFLFEFDN